MRRDDLADLSVFLVVAEERSFTRSAAKLGLSQSALSQTINRLEARLGLRLLARTTRSVTPTAAGERILDNLGPAIDSLDETISALKERSQGPSGSIRITTVEHAAKTILAPALAEFLLDHPGIEVEIIIDYGLTDIVAERFDAGVRLGSQVAKDMIAVRLSPDIPMAVAASPSYFTRHPVPAEPADLVDQQCINLTLPTAGAHYPWPFAKGGRETRVHVEGQVAFNAIDLILDASLAGLGLAFLPLDQVTSHLKAGRLVSVLEDWVRPLPGYHLYYPSRRDASPAFRLLVEACRYRVRGAEQSRVRRGPQAPRS